jgi:hypothetical protein
MKTTLRSFLLFGGLLLAAPLGAAPLIQTATFQQGTDGYSGTFDRRIGATASNHVNGADVNTVATSYFLDGGTSTLNDAGVTQGLIRFDNVVGAGGVPAGAKVISATVDMTTGGTSNAQTGGVYNLYQLNTPFDATSTWTTPFGGDGLAGNVSDLLGSYDGLAQNALASARADNAVQQWVDGAPNLGFGIRSDRNTDGWSPHTTGSATVASRPKLTVNYTLDPTVRVGAYQNGVNGYTGAVDIRLNNGDGSTTIGANDAEVDIDGFNATNGSPDRPYFLKFNGLNLAANQIFRAELVITTGFTSADATSPGAVQVHQLLRDWNYNTLYADLDSNGNPAVNDLNELIANGDIGPSVASVVDMANTEVMHIDVTSIVENWRAGQANYGFYLGTVATSNGWQLFSTGANEAGFRPELRIISIVPEPTTSVLAAAAALGLVVAARRRR